jgi:hypothetical protein
MVSPRGKKLMRSCPFLSQKTVAMIFWVDGKVLRFFAVGVFGAIALIVAYSQVCDEIPRFHFPSQYSPESSYLDPHNAQGTPVPHPLNFFVIICQRFWHPTRAQFPIA